MLASIPDINVHLPADKAQIEEGEDTHLQVDAQRVIVARLVSVFPDDVETWVDVPSTPEIIREIAGKLIAAKYYSNLVAEDEADGSVFAQDLYNQAIAMIEDIREGDLAVLDPTTGDPLENNSLVEASFWPNDTTVPAAFFATADEWA